MHSARAIALVAALWTAAAAASPNVILRRDLGATPLACGLRDCVEPYRSFVTRHAAFARPRPAAAVDAEIAAADALPSPARTALDVAQRRRAVREATGIGFLFDDFDARPLTVTTVAERDLGAWREVHVVFSDPAVGEFDALVLEPAARTAPAAVVGLHGHLDSPAIFAERYLGHELAAAGYLVVLPRLRAMDCLGAAGPELDVSRSLLEGGFTLIGLRAYEAALAAKYLRARSDVDPARIGLLSHSGGSSTGDVALWLSDAFAAHVVDHHQDWRNRCGFTNSLHCETVPALVPLAADLADEAGGTVPRLGVPYGYAAPETRREILTYLDDRLRDLYCPRLAPAACDGERLPGTVVRRAGALCAGIARAREETGRRRLRRLQRARTGWRALATRMGRAAVSPACREAVRQALRGAARQSDAPTPSTSSR